MIYEPGLMQVVSGRVVSVSQRTVSTEHVNVTPSGGVSTSEQNSEYIEINLDTHHEPFAVNSNGSRNFFIGSDDVLDIAGIWQGSHIDIYGIRNVTDGSVYVVRPERVESRSISYTVAAFVGLLGCGAAAWFAIDGERDPGVYFSLIMMTLLAAAGAYCIFSLRRWGVFSNAIIREHTQEGDKKEMKQAQAELRLTREERSRITPL